jgi:hypothetical protein
MKKFSSLMYIAVLGLILWLSWSCKDEITGADLSAIVFPDSGVSYAKQVQPLFDRGCGGQESICHGPDTFDARGYSLDSYLHATSGVGIIIRGKPDASQLITTIEGKTPPKMPPQGRAQLNANQIKGLRQWVQEGAQDN